MLYILKAKATGNKKRIGIFQTKKSLPKKGLIIM